VIAFAISGSRDACYKVASLGN